MVFMYCMHALENIQSKADDKKPIEYIIGEYVGVSGLSYSLWSPTAISMSIKKWLQWPDIIVLVKINLESAHVTSWATTIKIYRV